MSARAAALRNSASLLRAMAEKLEADAAKLERDAEPKDDLIRYHDAAGILKTSSDGVRKRVERGQLEKTVVAGRPFVSETAVRTLAATASAMSASASALSGCTDDETAR